MKNLLLILIYFTCSYSFSQSAYANKLVGILYAEKINQNLESLSSSNSKDLIDSEDSKKNIRKDLSKIFDEEYTQQELEALIVFYESAVGKKMLSIKDTITNKVLNAFYLWDAKVHGLDMLEVDLAESTDELLGDALKSSEMNKQDNIANSLKETRPQIKTLNDLKNYIKKDINVIYDAQFIAEILNLEDILNSDFEIEKLVLDKSNDNRD